MTPQPQVAELLTAEPAPPRRATRRDAVFLLVLLAGLIAAGFLLGVAAPSAGAAGGCGGG